MIRTAAGQLVEAQFTAEGWPFDRAMLDTLLNLVEKGIRELLAIQQRALDIQSGGV